MKSILCFISTIFFTICSWSQLITPPPFTNFPDFNCSNVSLNNPQFRFNSGRWFNNLGTVISKPSNFNTNATIKIESNYNGDITTLGTFTGTIQIDENATFTGIIPNAFSNGRIVISPNATLSTPTNFDSEGGNLIRVCNGGMLTFQNTFEIKENDLINNKGTITITNFFSRSKSSFFNLPTGTVNIIGNSDVVIDGRITNYGALNITNADVFVNDSEDEFQNFCNLSINQNLLLRRAFFNRGIVRIGSNFDVLAHTFSNFGTVDTDRFLVDDFENKGAIYTGVGENSYLLVNNRAELLNGASARGGTHARIYIFSDPGAGFITTGCDPASPCSVSSINSLTSFIKPDLTTRCKALYNPNGIFQTRFFIDTNNNGIHDTGEAYQENVMVTVTDSNSNTVSKISRSTGRATFFPRSGSIDINIVSIPTNLALSPLFARGNSFRIANIDADTLTILEEIPLIENTTPLSGFVFNDSNGNGTRDTGESGIAGVDINITDNAGTITTVTSTANGSWNANSIIPGSITINVVQTSAPLDGLRITSANPITRILNFSNLVDNNFGFIKTRKNFPEQLKITRIVTPNNDGKNDFLRVENIDDFPDNYMHIHQLRTGLEVYRAEGYGLNGKWFRGLNKRGSRLLSGTYYFTLIYKSDNRKKVYTGLIYLTR